MAPVDDNCLLRVDCTCGFYVQVRCAVTRLLHLNADWMCREIGRLSVPRDTTLHAVEDLHTFFARFLCAFLLQCTTLNLHMQSAHASCTYNLHQHILLHFHSEFKCSGRFRVYYTANLHIENARVIDSSD
jgi:hypothetical protein